MLVLQRLLPLFAETTFRVGRTYPLQLAVWDAEVWHLPPSTSLGALCLAFQQALCERTDVRNPGSGATTFCSYGLQRVMWQG